MYVVVSVADSCVTFNCLSETGATFCDGFNACRHVSKQLKKSIYNCYYEHHHNINLIPLSNHCYTTPPRHLNTTTMATQHHHYDTTPLQYHLATIYQNTAFSVIATAHHTIALPLPHHHRQFHTTNATTTTTLPPPLPQHHRHYHTPTATTTPPPSLPHPHRNYHTTTATTTPPPPLPPTCYCWWSLVKG